MYESLTFEEILEKMLANVSDSMDKREGSIIYDACAPAALALKQMYNELDMIMQESFADTATREYLIRKAAERGLTPREASMAVLQAELVGIDVPNGTRFSIGGLDYVVIDHISGTTYKLQCETPGTEGNRYFGQMLPVDYITGLKSATLTELLIPGEDEEDTETFRKRYLANLSEQAYGGNVADYKQRVGAIDGVGGVKVYPVWNGPGTVKVIISSSLNAVPTAELVQAVQTAVDPEQNHGEGLGFAPIGHIVTVQGAAACNVTVSGTITVQQGSTWTDIATGVTAEVQAYFSSLCANWAAGNTVVRISQVESHILNSTGVLDVEGLTLNGESKNLYVPDDSLPVLMEVKNVGTT